MRLMIIILLFLICSTVHSQSDTLNRTDSLGMKYGYWIIYGKDKPESGFAPHTIMEEGPYLNGKKTGIWKTYHRPEVIKSEVEYKNNRPNGMFKIYYDNSQIKESGTWRGAFYIGEYVRYFENGCIDRKMSFNKSGKSDSSIYYYQSDTCGLKYEEFYPNSQVKYIKYNRKGEIIKSENSVPIEPIDIKEYARREIKETFTKSEARDSTRINLLNESSKYFDYDCKCYKNLTEADNGYKKLYNENKQISIDGEFKNGKLLNGKYYLYDKNGLLEGIEIYKNGKYVGDADID